MQYSTSRVEIELRGQVQGVGMRPYLQRMAQALQLSGWVCNTPTGVLLQLQGPPSNIEEALARIQNHSPKAAKIKALHSRTISIESTEESFCIVNSQARGTEHTLHIPLDLSLCQSCSQELNDPNNRRFQYPFIACCDCGPRYSITLGLPFDRQNTAYQNFPCCSRCEQEYNDSLDRRFHAQTISCPECGPQLQLLDSNGHRLSTQGPIISQVSNAIKAGAIVALKSLGGFQLLVDPYNTSAINKLRQIKNRPFKPLALMFPNLMQITTDAEVGSIERETLVSSAAPIVLLKPKPTATLAKQVNPASHLLGVFLPFSGLHQLLLQKLNQPVIVTSANCSGAPLAVNTDELRQYFQNRLDLIIDHSLPVINAIDDSVVRVICDTVVVLRAGRGYTPAVVPLAAASPINLLAAGAEENNAICYTAKGARSLVLGPYVGKLEDPRTLERHLSSASTIGRLTCTNELDVVALDLHPDFTSRAYWEHRSVQSAKPEKVLVQHHYAHALSCITEHGIASEATAICWDGAGWCNDDTLWGGETLAISPTTFQRLASFLPFPLPGGDLANHETLRTALGLLFVLHGNEAQHHHALRELQHRDLLVRAIKNSVNSPLTTSVGRLFDAVAALLGICHYNHYQAQAAAALEALASSCPKDEPTSYPLPIITTNKKEPRFWIDWRPMLGELLIDISKANNCAIIAQRFHRTLSLLIVKLAQCNNQSSTVVLTGGCFQNKVLLEQAVADLREAGFAAYWNQRIPPNDNGLGVGQIMAALRVGQTERGSKNIMDTHKIAPFSQFALETHVEYF